MIPLHLPRRALRRDEPLLFPEPPPHSSPRLARPPPLCAIPGGCCDAPGQLCPKQGALLCVAPPFHAAPRMGALQLPGGGAGRLSEGPSLSRHHTAGVARGLRS